MIQAENNCVRDGILSLHSITLLGSLACFLQGHKNPLAYSTAHGQSSSDVTLWTAKEEL